MKSQSDGNSLHKVNYGRALLSNQAGWMVREIASERENKHLSILFVPETMLASEEILRRDWDTPTEDEAWAHL